MNTASNHSIYARWTANTYTVTFNRTNFINGEVVYFNPVTAKVCDASEAVSTTGTKTGCMKWYAFLDDGSDTIRLLLDHNTTATVSWTSSMGKSITTLATEILKADTSTWNSNIKNSARLISADEIVNIINMQNWNKDDINSKLYLHNGNLTLYQGTVGTNAYAWLFNNTKNCTTYGCDVSQEDNSGYWTSTIGYIEDLSYPWRITSSGGLFYPSRTSESDSHGVRPVIEIDKTFLNETKTVTYDSTYGKLPELSRPGYEFQGWYTTGGTKVESNKSVNIANNIEVYPQWIQNKYTVTFSSTIYENGSIVYFNPVTAQVCDASEAVSTTGTKDGCMKWYAFLDDGFDTVKLLLNHNTTASAQWANGGETIPTIANAQLAEDVSGWHDTIKNTARLITANEVNQIVPTDGTHVWNINDYTTWYEFHYGNQTVYNGPVGSNKYAWLFDNTKNCELYGCNSTEVNAASYWTSSNISSEYAWHVGFYGDLYYADLTKTSGIRPVVEISKDIIGGTLSSSKYITYNNQYGELPTPTKIGYTFQGWYTSGGVKVESSTIVKTISDQTLYAQWKNLYEDGNVVYYDVTTGKSCTNYHIDNSITGYNGTTETKTTNNQNGCLKFYSFLSEKTDYVNLFLDHDTTTYTCWNNRVVNGILQMLMDLQQPKVMF